jgi:4-amino-4-deoxy-L-arabinose transferase-like glycosyltransferase
MYNINYTHINIFTSKINIIFALFCLLHLLLWTLAPTFIYANPPTDSLEGITWGNLWLWGYSKHPPLAPWLSAAFTDLFGIVGWPLYLLSQISIIICFIAIYQLGKKILPIGYALIGVMLLEGINFYNIESAIFNPNVLMLPLWALMTLFFYNAMTDNRWRDWLLLGICTGLAMLTKYESALLILIMFIFMLSFAKTRAYFRSPHMYVAGILAFLIFLPNFIWLVQHHFIAVNYALAEMKPMPTSFWHTIIMLFSRPLYFILEQFGAICLMFLLYLPFYNSKNMEPQQVIEGSPSIEEQRNRRSLASLGMTPGELDKFNYRFLAFMALGPMIGTVSMSLLFQTELVSRWAFPFFSTLGLFALATLKPMITPDKMKSFLKILSSYSAILIIGMIFYFLYLPILQNRDMHSDSFPGEKIALTLTKEWHELFHTKLSYVAGDHHVSVNIVAFSPDKPMAYFNCSENDSPWVKEQDLREKGGIFIIRLIDDAAPQKIAEINQRFPGIIKQSEVLFARKTQAKVPPVKLWIGYLPPKKGAS